MEWMLMVLCALVCLAIILIIVFRPRANNNLFALNTKLDELFRKLDTLSDNLKTDFKTNREENSFIAAQNRKEVSDTLHQFRQELNETLQAIIAQNKSGSEQLNKTLEEKIQSLVGKVDSSHKESREALSTNLKDFSLEQKAKSDELKEEQKQGARQTVEQLERITAKVEEKLNTVNEQAKADAHLMRETLHMSFKGFRDNFIESVEAINNLQRERFGKMDEKQMLLVNKTEEKLNLLNNQAKEDNSQIRASLATSFKEFQASFDKNVQGFNDLQREKFGQLEDKQQRMVESTEKKLEQMRETVEEKLQKTLQDRLGQSFDMVTKQLTAVQQGLGEMQTLAQDVGGLKRVLSNVKMRGGFGEVQLQMLLENILAPEQYEANVVTKKGSGERVEFAVKFPNKEGDRDYVWLPIDAKFPKDAYEYLQNAYDAGEPATIEAAQKALEAVIKKMAKDICEKYIDAPDTTNFGIMFLPFEGLFAEVVRKASLLEEIQRDCKVIITGPTTLAVILNSLQMGFRTLAIQKRSSQVWQVLGAVKKEFNLFGNLLEKAQTNIQVGLNQLDDVVGVRTRQINRKLKDVQVIGDTEGKCFNEVPFSIQTGEE
jgi:DNA recombination protein RmuC